MRGTFSFFAVIASHSTLFVLGMLKSPATIVSFSSVVALLTRTATQSAMSLISDRRPSSPAFPFSPQGMWAVTIAKSRFPALNDRMYGCRHQLGVAT